MQRKKGFTLIELLVVIAIIALLMAILLPALARVKQQAEAVACMANLKQWALAYSMYVEENNGYFSRWDHWTEDLKPYYKDEKLLFCPSATMTFAQGAPPAFAAWASSSDPLTPVGSYAYNTWTMSDGSGAQLIEDMWKTPYVKDAARIPLVGDADSYGLIAPRPEDEPPDYEGEAHGHDGEKAQMRTTCIVRHNGNVNWSFCDFSVRKVGLKELWILKWNRVWFKGDPDLPDWPPWMRKFKDYPR